jgi:hypothetical protein
MTSKVSYRPDQIISKKPPGDKVPEGQKGQTLLLRGERNLAKERPVLVLPCESV